MLRRATSRRVGFAYEYLFELSQKGEAMRIIICLDDDNGMLFHDRRQSQDVKLRADVLQRLGERMLWMNAYSARQFADAEDARIAFWKRRERMISALWKISRFCRMRRRFRK